MTAAAVGGRDDQPRSPAPDQVTVLAQFIAASGREADVCDALLHLVEPSRADDGNVSYDLHQLKNNPVPNEPCLDAGIGVRWRRPQMSVGQMAGRGAGRFRTRLRGRLKAGGDR